MNMTLLNALISPVEKKPTCFSNISPIFFHQETFSFSSNTYKHPGMKEHFLRKAHKSILIWGKEGNATKFMGKNDNLQISTDKNIFTLKFTCE